MCKQWLSIYKPWVSDSSNPMMFAENALYFRVVVVVEEHTCLDYAE